LDKLPFEKVQNMIFKNILGVHGKASNITINAELGTFPACFKSFILNCFSVFLSKKVNR
jgi:hypothetical protein